MRCHCMWRYRLWGHGVWRHRWMMLWRRRGLVMRPGGSVMSELRWAGRLSHGVSSVGVIYRRIRNVREAILRRRRRRRRGRMVMLLRSHIGAHPTKMIPRRRPRNSLRLRGTVTRSKCHPIPYGRGSRRRMSDVLEAGMTWQVGGNHGRIWRRRMHIFGGRRRLIFVIIIVAFAVKVFRAFVFMWGTKLKA